MIEPTGTGTRRDMPSSRPFMDASTRLVARAAPVELGTMLTAPARARRRSVCVQVEQVLIVGVGVHRGHQPADDVEGVVEHLDHRHEAVGGARGVGDDQVRVRVELVVVDADDEGGVGVGRGAEMMTRLHRAVKVARRIGPRR